MANAPQGALRFAGVWADGAFQVVRSGSTKPDTIRADFILGANLPQYGDIEVWYGDQFIRLPNCRLVREEISGGVGGRMRRCHFEDRRWAWNWNFAWGHPSNNQGNFLAYSSVQTPYPQVIRDLFAAVGDMVSGSLPTDAFFTPVYNKDGDLTGKLPTVSQEFHFDGRVASDCIEEALAPSGMQVHLGWDNRIRLFAPGYGRERPEDQRVMDYTVSKTPPVVPEYLFYEWPVLFENDFLLEPVGYMWTPNGPGNIAYPLSELNYGPGPQLPNGGYDWSLADPPFFFRINNLQHRELCKRTIFKHYRVKFPLAEGVQLKFQNTPRGSGVASDPTDFKDIERSNVEFDSELPVRVYGYFANLTMSRRNNNVAINPALQLQGNEFHSFSDTDMRGQFPQLCFDGEVDFDSRNNVVKFRDFLVFINRNNAGAVQKTIYQPAKLILRAAHRLTKKSNSEYIRYVLPVAIDSLLRAPGIYDKIKVTDDPIYVTRTAQQAFGNYQQMVTLMTGRYLASKRMTESATIPMKGFCFDINTDGRIPSVTFERSERGECTTQVQWQKEHPLFSPEYAIKTAQAIQEAINHQAQLATLASRIRSQKQRRARGIP